MFVRFALEADLLFSAELAPDAIKACEELVEESNKTLFKKGVPAGIQPDEIGRIVRWSAEGNRLSVTIVSGPYTRAHDGLFRLRKQIAPTLGRFRIGLRDIVIRSFGITMKGDFPKGIHIPNLPFISKAVLLGDTLDLALVMNATDLENRVPDRVVRLIEEKVQAATYGGKSEHWELEIGRAHV
jgi:seryl-tRNA synthetase